MLDMIYGCPIIFNFEDVRQILFFKGLDSFSGNHQDRLVLLTIVALDLCQARFPDSPVLTEVWTAFLALIKIGWFC